MNNYSDVHYNMTATAIARNGGGRSDNNGGVDVRVKLKSRKGPSNTSMAGGNDLRRPSEHDVIEPKFRRVVARNSQRYHRGERASLGGAVSRAEGRGTKERERRRVSHALFFEVKEYQKQQLMTQQDEQEQHQRDMMDANQRQPRPHSAMTLHPTLGSNGSVSSFQQHHYK